MSASQSQGPTRRKEPLPSATSLMSGANVHWHCQAPPLCRLAQAHCMPVPVGWSSCKRQSQRCPIHEIPLTSRRWVSFLMEEGKSRTLYITQRVKGSLQLPVRSKKLISIAAFGLRRGRPKQCEVVQLAVRTKHHGYHNLEVLMVPHIL